MRRWALYTAAALAIAMTLCYRLQPDALAALTLIPAWLWLIPAALLVIVGRRRRYRRLIIVVVLLWGLFAFLVIDEWPGLLRRATGDETSPSGSHGSARLRVVSLNCYFGQAAGAVKTYQPDIVLLQESPNEEMVQNLARELFGDEGSSLWNVDTSIICRGKVRNPDTQRGRHFTTGIIVLPSGAEVEVASVRLAPPVFRVDFWTPSWWAEHRDKRREHRQEIAELEATLEQRDAGRATVVGGDMNSPANDAGLWVLRGRVRDAFAEAGVGWGGTGPTNYPLWRVDQIWGSSELKALQVFAEPVTGSDHRIVVCDFEAPRPNIR